MAAHLQAEAALPGRGDAFPQQEGWLSALNGRVSCFLARNELVPQRLWAGQRLSSRGRTRFWHSRGGGCWHSVHCD